MKSNYLKLLLLTAFLICSLSTFAQKDSLSFLALGDSYTIGTSELPRYAWPVQLREKLRKKGPLLKAPKIIAGAGWTTKKLLEQMNQRQLSLKYDLVSLLIGVNNQYRNQSITEFRNDLSLLLDTCIVLAKNDASKVFVLSIPDWSVTPFAKFKDKEKIVKEIKAYNSIIKVEVEKRNIRLIDITKLSRKALYDHSLIASDSLHPSRRMYKEWVNKISKTLQKIN